MVGMLHVDLMKGPYMVYATRLDWFSLAPRYEEFPGDATPLRTPVTNVRVYCTGGPPCWGHMRCIERIQRLQEHDMIDRQLPDIAPNFLIGSDGTVFEGRGWTKEATKSMRDFPEFKDNCIDFAYIGDYADKDPPVYLSSTLINMIIYGIKHKKIRSWFKIHNQYNKTDLQPYSHIGQNDPARSLPLLDIPIPRNNHW